MNFPVAQGFSPVDQLQRPEAPVPPNKNVGVAKHVACFVPWRPHAEFDCLLHRHFRPLPHNTVVRRL